MGCIMKSLQDKTAGCTLRHLGHTWFFMTAQPGLLLQKTPNQPFIKSVESTLGFGTQQLFQQSCSSNTLMLWSQMMAILYHLPTMTARLQYLSLSPHSLKFLGWWILRPTCQQSSGMNCLTCTSHLAQQKIEILTQFNPMLQKFTETRKSWAKNPHHYNVFFICASPIPGILIRECFVTFLEFSV